MLPQGEGIKESLLYCVTTIDDSDRVDKRYSLSLCAPRAVALERAGDASNELPHPLVMCVVVQ